MNGAVLERLPESFKTGLGLPYDAFGLEGARGIERLFAPWFRTVLVSVALPQLEGVVAKCSHFTINCRVVHALW